jgi:predicted nucleic acid-binding protein
MRLPRKNLLDLNVLVALIDDEHVYHRIARRWFDARMSEEWGLCPLTEAGLVRLTTNPALGPMLRTFAETKVLLDEIAMWPGYRYWPITESWATLVTDAYLLGLAIKEDGVLVTFDKGIRFMAGAEFSRNLLILNA